MGLDLCKGDCRNKTRINKIPSATNTNFRVLKYLCKEYPEKIHISLGMTKERRREVKVFDNQRLKDLVLYHCISSYPVENEMLYLLELKRLISNYGDKISGIGFSGHHKVFHRILLP